MAPADDADDATTNEALTDATTSERGGPPGSRARRMTGDRYRIADRLARGGMGEIMEAHDIQIGRDVAIKRMRAEAPSERAIGRFLREAKIQGRLDHPAIVPVYELGRDVDGRPYFAMKKLAGTTLASLLAAGGPSQRLLRAFVDVCLAVEFAHQRGFIHRDLKPDNIMLGDYGETYVLDWGVAKVKGEAEPELELSESSDDHTAVGAAIGTPGYMAPEQALGEADIDARADIYSLGCVLFEILAGERLHPRGKKEGLASAIAAPDGRPSKRAPEREIPPELDELCARATAARDVRLASARELGERVQHYLDGDRDVAQRRSLAQAHHDAARAALDAGDRRAAMRSAGRAIALDPTLRDAAELVSRLMLEPPKEVPPEVSASLESQDLEVLRNTVPFGIATSFGYFALIPMLLWAGMHAGYAIAVGILSLLNIRALMKMLRGRGVKWEVLVYNAAIVAILARVGSPFVLAAGCAPLVALGVLSGQWFSRRDAVMVWGILVAAVMLPWVGELAGVLSQTITFAEVAGDGRLVIDGALFVNAGVTYTTLPAYTLLAITASVTLTHGLRRSEHRARRQLHLQTWQLRQLVAD